MRYAVMTLCLPALLTTLAAAEPAGKPVTFAEVKPILRKNCRACHNADERKNDLSLDTVADIKRGGSGGAAVVAGRPTKSPLYLSVAHEDGVAAMPPKGKLTDAEIATIRAWIEQGLREKADDAGGLPARRTDFDPAAVPSTTAAAGSGPPPMPVRLPALDLPEPRRPHPVTAMAVSPRAPLLAVAGASRVLLFDTSARAALGALPFPEGTPFVLRFSRDGGRLLVAGGRHAQSGSAVLFDVRTGKRLTAVGDEADTVLAADLSPDQSMIALGGPGRVVKVFATADGRLLHKLTRHTDWITAVEFSPDGARLATADRNGGVHLWDSKTGGIALSLSEHKEGVNALAWRSDGKLLATGGEDGRLIVWDAADGWPVSDRTPHQPKSEGPVPPKGRKRTGGGVLSVAFTPAGELVSAGRDRTVRLASAGGEERLLAGPLPALPTRVAAAADGRTVLVGDDRGGIGYLPTTPAK
jgi:mono/diheme cytochrome c family protein